MLVQAYAMRAQREPLSPFEYEAQVGAGQALVEVAGCGVCHTDLGFLDDGVPTRHELPLVLGHEVSGKVVEAGEGSEHLVGRNVVVPAVIPCGECELCKRERGQICKKQVFPGNHVHGGFASHLVVPAHGVIPVAQEGDDLRRLSVVADAVSTAYQAVRRSGLWKDDFAIFVGAGGVGGFGVQVAAALGARVLAIDVDSERLSSLKEFGAEWVVDAKGKTPREIRKEVRGITKAAGVPQTEWRIFETSGTAPGQETAFALLTFGAYLGVVGYHAGEVNLRLSNLMAFDATAEGNWGCLPKWFGEVIDLVGSGRIKLEPFVEQFPMSQIGDVFDKLRNHQLKRRPILVPDFAN